MPTILNMQLAADIAEAEVVFPDFSDLDEDVPPTEPACSLENPECCDACQ